MRDFVAFVLFLFVAIFIIAAMSTKPPTNKYEQVICANITCYYEIKE